MAEVTRQELAELRRMIDETYWMARGALTAVTGRERADNYARQVKAQCSPWGSDRALYRVGLGEGNMAPLQKLQDRGLITLDDVAATPRDEVAAIPGVGPQTLAQIEAAMTSHGMSWDVAA